MARAAKTAAVASDLTEREAKRLTGNILSHYDEIESARGRFMQQARDERERMTEIYEQLAQLGISQKASRLNIKITRLLTRITGLIADLEAEDRKQAIQFAKLQGAKEQLSLFGELPRAPRPTRAARPPRAAGRARMRVVETEPAGEPADAA